MNPIKAINESGEAVRALSASASRQFSEQFNDSLENGSYEAILIAKSWNNSKSLDCYFEIPSLSKHVNLKCWRQHRAIDRKYKPVNSEIDFSEAGIEGRRYIIEIEIGKTGWMRFMNAEELSSV